MHSKVIRYRLSCGTNTLLFQKKLLLFSFYVLIFQPVQSQISSHRIGFSCTGDLPTQRFPSPLPSDNGFRLTIVGQPQAYQPLHDYTVTLQSTLPASFRGFAIKSVNENGDPTGVFMPVNTHSSQVMASCDNVITNVNEGKKVRVQVRWRAPLSGCVRLSASVIQKGRIWFKDSGALTIQICEEDAVAPSSGSDASLCCSCGRAKYIMTFYGLWSPTSHPKDYPAFSTHWSNIIGASHSPNYVIWEYGGYASEGVQKVAEWGWSDNLEDEIRAQSDDDVMSVIKTKAQWPAYQPRNLREPPSDEFEVDASRHVVSLLTMLGPSPDWNVGISKESMCTEACGWIGTKIYDLIPWDAGTDNGVTYMSANSPTAPHETIRNITSSDHPRSPFYNPDGGPIPPVARVVIQRLNISGNQCGPSEALQDTSDVIPTLYSHGLDSGPETCMYSDWSNWSECGVTCGWGIKVRNRMVKFRPDLTECSAIMEKEICLGTGQCSNQSAVTTCLYSEWASWSECSKSCGNSTRVRARALKWPSEPQQCHGTLKEMSHCFNVPCQCVYSQWSEWMRCPVTCGIGQTIRKRALLSSSGECRAPLSETSQCMKSMTCTSNIVAPAHGCDYSAWADWSPCPVPCGVGQSVREKGLLVLSMPQCALFITETSKCMTSSSCSNYCAYGNWSDWMPCSASCGEGETTRKRFLTDASSGENCDDIVMEKAPCHNGPCDTQPTSQCVYLPWSRWMPCPVQCGKGETLRKRFLSRTASKNCPDLEMETNICLVACDVNSSPQCAYSDWSPWMPCSNCKTFRKKLLLASFNAISCKNIVKERKKCQISQCRRGKMCRTSQWQSWTQCSVSCGTGGHMTRSRHVINQSRSTFCKIPVLTQRRKCRDSSSCRSTCDYSIWSTWSTCMCEIATQSSGNFQVRRRISRTQAASSRRCTRKTQQRRRCTC